MYNEEFKKNLINILKKFQNRPNHLAKYLIENSALNDSFVERILKSDKLDTPEPIFLDIAQMEEFYNSLIDINAMNSEEERLQSMNDKLDNYILEEKFEEAAKLRDYMKKNKIKRLK